ncbi:hypothetical protein FOTG_19247 [Fusarium oxysporum f. sp. vasinfectum 25433]|uniref:Uncharacterized protein n=1 Tax=Fusarium oxysporum f. sp. vasinfectum 25433 TaxID=1089449 RepID=X0KTY4_FUSOX|nr:hypothetical protein FOTG_19247 [Fusarium oxysporum f. sp. vasinfectum 25433]
MRRQGEPKRARQHEWNRRRDGRGLLTDVSHTFTFLGATNSPTHLMPRSSRRRSPRYCRLASGGHGWWKKPP